MTNYFINNIDISNDFILSTTIPNGSNVITGYYTKYNGNYIDIGQIYDTFVNYPTPYNMDNSNFIINNGITYDIRKIIYNTQFTTDSLGSAEQNGTNGTVYAIAVSESNIYVGGNFTTVSDSTQTISVNNIAKWNGSWSALGNGTSGIVRAIAISGSNVYVGGDFTTVSDSTTISAKYIAKWDGAWSALGNGTNGIVYAIAISDSNVYIGGNFTTATVSGVTISVNNIAMWNGSWSALGTNGDSTKNGTGGTVYAIAVSGTETDIYVGGDFTTVSDTTISARNIVKWNGSWSPLGVGIKNGTNNIVTSIKVLGTNVYVGGNFTKVYNSNQSILVNRIAIWNNLSNSWSALGSIETSKNGTSGIVFALAVSGTDVYVGGDFTRVSDSTQTNVSASNIAKWDGTKWYALGIINDSTKNGTNGIVRTIAISGTDVYVAGEFTTVSDSTQTNLLVNRIAKWDGTKWYAFGTGTNGIVRTIAISGTDVYVGGDFTRVSDSTQTNVSANRIAKWNGSWSTLGDGTSGVVRTIAISGTDVYVGGDFTRVSDISANRIAKWNGSWSVLGTTLQNGVGGAEINSIAILGTNLYVGGGFNRVSDQSRFDSGSINRIAIWDNTLSLWKALGTIGNILRNGANGTIHAILVSGTDIYVGGEYTSLSDSTQINLSANRIAKWNGSWNVVGINEPSQNGTDSEVCTFGVLGKNLYVGGDFTTLSDTIQQDISANRFVEWDGVSWSAVVMPSNGTNGQVNSIESDNNNLFVGGNFTKVSDSTQINVPSKYLSIWNGKKWNSIKRSSDNGPNNIVNAIGVSESNVYIGGSFNQFTYSSKTISVNNITKL